MKFVLDPKDPFEKMCVDLVLFALDNYPQAVLLGRYREKNIFKREGLKIHQLFEDMAKNMWRKSIFFYNSSYNRSIGKLLYLESRKCIFCSGCKNHHKQDNIRRGINANVRKRRA